MKRLGLVLGFLTLIYNGTTLWTGSDSTYNSVITGRRFIK